MARLAARHSLPSQPAVNCPARPAPVRAVRVCGSCSPGEQREQPPLRRQVGRAAPRQRAAMAQRTPPDCVATARLPHPRRSLPYHPHLTTPSSRPFRALFVFYELLLQAGIPRAQPRPAPRLNAMRILRFDPIVLPSTEWRRQRLTSARPRPRPGRPAAPHGPRCRGSRPAPGTTRPGPRPGPRPGLPCEGCPARAPTKAIVQVTRHTRTNATKTCKI